MSRFMGGSTSKSNHQSIILYEAVVVGRCWSGKGDKKAWIGGKGVSDLEMCMDYFVLSGRS